MGRILLGTFERKVEILKAEGLVQRFAEKFIIFIITLSIVLNPLMVLVPENVRAANATNVASNLGTNKTITIDINTQKSVGYSVAAPTPGKSCSAPAVPQGYNDLLALMEQYSGTDGNLSFSDLFIDPNNPAIVMNQSDRDAVNTMMCMTAVLPNYDEDFTTLYSDLPQTTTDKAPDGRLLDQATVMNAVNAESGKSTPRYKTYQQYFNFLKYGGANQNPAEHVNDYNYFTALIKEAGKSRTSTKLVAVWADAANKIAQGIDSGIAGDTLACVTGLSLPDLKGKLRPMSSDDEHRYVADLIRTATSALSIDVRVINTLIYLVTPKDKGGAGHWRVRVARLLQSDQQSRESTGIIQRNNNTATPTLMAASANSAARSVPCDSTMTAAECGSLQTSGNAVVQEQDGTQYDAFFQNMDKEAGNDANISAHNSGQAIDISELDDLRCTLVKKRRLGGDIKQKQPIKPIKLVWQTTDGYTQSGGNSIDQMGMMKDLAKQSIVDMLSSLNGDVSDYSGDLTKANFTDLVGILGQSLLAGVVSTPGHDLSSFNTSDTLKSLGAMYFADYFGLPKEIFKGVNITDLENLKYVIGRSAVEKKLGLPFGSLDNLDLQATAENDGGKPVHNLNGLLTNVGQRKLEYEMGLNAHDLDRYYQLMSPTTGQYIINNTSLGRIVIENDLNLPKNSWPISAVNFSELKDSISDARVAILRIDPGYIDSILHIDPGSTQSFIKNNINSEQFAERVGISRYNNTTAGLKYFAMNNNAYQLPGPTADNPTAMDTWAEALKGNPVALQTIGIYTLARLLGENSLDMATKNFIPDGATFQSAVISSSDGTELNIPFNRTTYGQFVFRDWLRTNLTVRINAKDGCGKPAPDSSAINITYSGQTVYKGPADLSHPTQADATNTVNGVCPLYTDIKINDLKYSDTSGQHELTETSFPPGMFVAHQKISESSALSAGLESSDLYAIMGFRQADARSVFERIGAKMLYYGIANKAASPEEKATIDLKNTNPSFNVNSDSTLTFYLSRILKIQGLLPKIKTEWTAISTTDPEAKDINDKINKIVDELKTTYAETGFDLTKIRAIAGTVVMLKVDLADLKNNLEILKDRYGGIDSADARNKVSQINALIYDVNTLILAASEIMAGHTINSTDALSIDQINQMTAKSKGGVSGQGLSDWEIMMLVFELLSNKIAPEDFLLRLGANTAEGKLGLPRNSLLYLVQNFEQYGLSGIDTLYEALGQAQIENQFSLPTYYFQGNTIRNTMPRFALKTKDGKYTDLINWAADPKTGQKLLVAYASYQILHARTTNPGTVSSSAEAPKQASIDQWIDNTKKLSLSTFRNWVLSAQKNWLAKNPSIVHSDKTVDDIVANISARGFAGGIQSAQNDLLMRLGFPTGIYSGLTQNSPISWQLANSRAAAIDTVLKLPSGYTKMLFTGDKTITSKTISQKDKNILQSSKLNISNSELEKYIQMLNGALLPTEIKEYGDGNQTDYVVDNPYADPQITGPTCPVTYTAKGGFMVNETIIPSNSFCYYDKKGRHCFQSQDEATHFATTHDSDRITDILGNIATNLAIQLNLTDKYEDIYNGLKKFVSNKTAVTIFSDNILVTLTRQQGNTPPANITNTDQINMTRDIFSIAFLNIDPAVLMNLFTRTTVDSPLSTYKVKVGTWVAQAVLTAKIFNGLGLNIDPKLFDGRDFYDILTGDYSSLYRLGSTMVDRALSIKPGTTIKIVTALSPEGRKCALDSAGGGLLGSAFGLNYLPFDKLSDVNNFTSILGEEKIEETLNLPRGTFRVSDNKDNNNLSNLINNVGIINFFVAFKLPLDLTDTTIKSWFSSDVQAILGNDRYNSVRNASPQYQLAQVKTFLSSALVITQQSDVGRQNIESSLKDMLFSNYSNLWNILASTDPNVTLIKPITGTDAAGSNAAADYNQQVKNFYNQMGYIDSTLGLDKFSTGLLLSQRTKPSDYISSVGNALGIRVGAMDLARLLGLDQVESQAATDLATNIQKVFSCSSNGQYWRMGQCHTGSGLLGGKKSDYYHNWGYLYSNMDKVFDFRLDHDAGLPTGTVQAILDTPNNTFPILLGIGATKLDAQTHLDSTKTYSFTGLYKAMLPAESGAYQNTCHAKIFPNGEDVILDNQIAAAVNDLRGAKTDPDRADKATALQALQDRATQNARDLQSCIDLSKQSTPDYQARAWEFAQQAAAQYIHDNMLNIDMPGCRPNLTNNQSCNIGIDMPITDIRAMFTGDLRYMQAAGMAMGANLAFIEIGNIGTRNCNPGEKIGCNQAVPAGMRISYDEIKLALFGLPQDQLVGLAAWNTENNLGGVNDYAPDPDKNSSFANIHGNNGSISGIMTSLSNSNNGNNDATRSVPSQVAYQYGYTPANVAKETTLVQNQLNDYNAAAIKGCAKKTDPTINRTCIDHYYDNDDNYSLLQSRLNLLTNPQKYTVLDFNPSADEVQRSAMNAAQDKMKFDMMDIALWKIDENIFPGFSQIMVNGNTGEKWAALAQYTHNGLVNGHLFGIDFKGIDDNLVNAGAASIAILTATTQPQKQAAYDNLGTSGLNTLTNWISNHSEKYLGFKLNTDITSGLLVSIFTGNLGASAFSLNGVFGLDNAGKAPFIGGRQFTTLGGAVMNFGLGKVFAWADKALGLKPGQSTQLFEAARSTYSAVKSYAAAKSALDAARKTLDNFGGDTGADGYAEAATKVAKGEAAKAAAQEAIRQAAGAAVQLALSIIVDKVLGKTLGSIEDSLGLVPGSIAPLISAGLYVGVVAAVNSGFFGSAAVGFLPAIGPWGWAAIAGMFVLTNLFGVYRIEYWCDADGYFPAIGGPDATKNDVSGLGVMGGRLGPGLNALIKTLSIQAAQYKAQRLIGDTLEIQYNGDYNDVNGLPTIPTQIMTGRAEDVDYWKNTVLNNVCKQRLSTDAQMLFNGIAAVCDAGMRRMGLWQNPQTVAWTHIGF